MTVYTNGPLGGGGSGIEVIDTYAHLPLTSTPGTVVIVEDTGTLYYWTGTMWAPVTAAVSTSGNLTEAVSDVLIITGGTGAVIGSGTSIDVKQATSLQDGYLSSIDWNIFNSKQPALGFNPVRIETPYTLTSTDILNKYITISVAPTTPNKTQLEIAQAPQQAYGIDFTVAGTQVTWSGLALDGILAAGDILTIIHD